METPFTNVHVHVFTSACAPKNFLRIVKSELTRTFPGTIKKVLENKYARQAIWKLNKGILTLNDWLRRRKKGRRRSGLEKYLSFLDVGTRYTQTEIFEEAFSTAKAHDSTARVFGLTLDMDFMDRDGIRPEMPLETQLVEIKKIKRFHPHKFFAFLSVDPRSRSDDELLNWAKTYFETGVTDMKTGITYPYFAGIKLYPALGFFPFDPGLEKLYAYAEDNGIPVMTHCTRSGSLYIGDNIERLIPEEPAMMMPSPANSVAIKAQEEIYSLIKEFYKKGWIKNSSRGNNDIACDLFGSRQEIFPAQVIAQVAVAAQRRHGLPVTVGVDLAYDRVGATQQHLQVRIVVGRVTPEQFKTAAASHAD
ncbi:MAG: hypothetical protein IIA77_00430, partial [Proteobacteria bacterium]|nr:hypothetical protein [Pseudomonadota bacterium]